MAGARPRFTRRDFDAMPEDWRGELIEGALVMAPPPAPYHQFLLTQLLHRLLDHLGPEGTRRVLVSPVAVQVDDENVFLPDLLVLPEGAGVPHPEWRIPVPLWVVEILSPGTARYDRSVKLPWYGNAGVAEAWLIAPRRRRIEIHDLELGRVDVRGDGDVARSLTVPGFELAVAEFFATPSS